MLICLAFRVVMVMKKFFKHKKDNFLSVEKHFFDIDFYLETNPDLRVLKEKELFEHYHSIGWREGRDPAEWFSSSKYISANKDVANIEVDPLYHYVRFGMKEGRAAFKSDARLRNSIDSSGESKSSIEIVNCKNNCDVPSAVKQAVNEKFYRAHYKDVPDNYDCAEHYFLFGWKEGRDPNESFSTLMFHLANHIDPSDKTSVCPLVLDNLSEKVVFKSRKSVDVLLENDCENEIKVCAPYIDNEYYSNTYGVLKDQVVHFCTIGYKLGYCPNKWFDTKEYVNNVGILKLSGINPLYYYLEQGYLYGGLKTRVIKGKFDLNVGIPLSISPCLNNYGQYVKDLKHKEQEQLSSFDSERLHIHWIMPDYFPGSGGHMTIFRAIRYLELNGVNCEVWIIGNPNKEYYLDIVKNFQTIKADVNILSYENYPLDGDAIIATSWDTVEWAKKIKKDQSLFYFVQDYEKLFYPQGSKSLLAEMTYFEDINCICASPWLKNVMENKYGRNACSFMLGYNSSEYYIDKSIKKFNNFDGKKHIAVYSRIFTERRAVELVIMALHLLAKKRSDFIVHFFGGGLELPCAPFDYVMHGSLTPEGLNNLYNSCDFGICFSATNYSLVPQEMMASGLPVLELDGKNTRAIFPENVIKLANPYPKKMADDIEFYLDNDDERNLISSKAKEWVSRITWDTSFANVYSFIKETCVRELSSTRVNVKLEPVETHDIYASVVIPVYNPDKSFKKVLMKTCSQKTTWPFEVILIDSSSKKCEWCEDFASLSDKIVYHKIPQKEFQHGKTRNLGVELSKGQFVAFITQDALPYDEYWLYNIVTVLSKYDDVSIAFGKHYPYADSNAFVKRDLINHFKYIESHPMVLGQHTDYEKYLNKDEGWMQLLHFYSDNNSCLKKKYWKKVPMRNVDYGEDQLLALDMINAGYRKVYVPSAGVYHSHNFNPDQTYERCKIEFDFFKNYFGYNIVKSFSSYDKLEKFLNENDKAYAKEHNISEEELEMQLLNNKAKAKGYFNIQD